MALNDEDAQTYVQLISELIKLLQEHFGRLPTVNEVTTFVTGDEAQRAMVWNFGRLETIGD